MKRPAFHHYSEEDLLMHMLGEEAPELGAAISSHLEECHECKVILQEYQGFLEDIRSWKIEEISEAAWQEQKERLLAIIQDNIRGSRPNIWFFVAGAISRGWDYALAHPLPAGGYIFVTVTFLLHEAISMFGLDQIPPTTGEVIQVLRQIL